MSRLERGDLLAEIVVPPPGPISCALSARLARFEAPGTNTLGDDDAPTIVWHEAAGANVRDVDGNRYVDLTSGFGVAAIGHRHPKVVAALTAQASRLVHGLGDVAAHPARVALAERLALLAPVDEPRVQFAVSGADAVEIAIKSAILHTGRPKIVAFEPAYHGTTLGALAASSRREFRAPFAAHLHRHVVRRQFAAPLAPLARRLAKGDVAAVVVEPVVGREGVLVPPPGWLAELALIARRHGALFVADEIFTGCGRTGRFFAVEHDGVRPDLLCCGKALGGGLPIAAVLGSAEVMASWRSGGEALHTATFVAHPLACAAALAALDVIHEERLVERAALFGPRLGSLLEALARRALRPPVVRGIGLLYGLEFESAAEARAVVLACRGRGLLLLAGGPEGRIVQLVPPLSIARRQLEFALAVLAEVLAAPEVEARG